MMSNSNTCFNCDTKIEDDSYGLTQCPSCHTPIFIDFDGHVQKPPEDEAVEGQATPDDPNEPQESSSLSSIISDTQSEMSLEDQNKITDESEVLGDPSHGKTSFQEAFNPDLFSEEQNPQSDFDMPQDNFLTDSSSQETNHDPEKSDLESFKSEDDIHKTDSNTQQIDDKHLQDVIDYANSPDDLDLGSFYYNVIISGIDSKNLRQSVLDALDDSRFGWKKEEIDSLIKDGCLTIEKLNAAKTYILISYLKFLSVKVKWDQVSLTKSYHGEETQSII